MRALQLTVVAVLAAALFSLPTGCKGKGGTTPTPAGGGTGGGGTPSGSDTGGGTDKLKSAIVGKWEKDGDHIEYAKDGEVHYKINKQEFKGKYEVTDASNVKETFTLTDDQIKALKEDAAKKVFWDGLKEPAKENTWTVGVSVDGNKLTRNKVEFTKK
jgi:hypothetical protein